MDRNKKNETINMFRFLFLFLVGEERLELSNLAAPAPKAGVYTNFTTRPDNDSKTPICLCFGKKSLHRTFMYGSVIFRLSLVQLTNLEPLSTWDSYVI